MLYPATGSRLWSDGPCASGGRFLLVQRDRAAHRVTSPRISGTPDPPGKKASRLRPEATEEVLAMLRSLVHKSQRSTGVPLAESFVRRDEASDPPPPLALLRRLTLSLLHAHPAKLSMAKKRYVAALDPTFLEEILRGDGILGKR